MRTNEKPNTMSNIIHPTKTRDSRIPEIRFLKLNV